ncbi:MAG: division/cell wall cluster transcriptional repressor MraZ [Agathobaculum sp.]|uniref:division/cell wall cluster transcriptional repressor MraZ n=1 Tax=Agathobaculum sp. TaxID=2048138 RepID=UPI003D92341F
MKGEYKHSIDAKGRLAMPAKLREELGDRFTITKGRDGCLYAYPEREWEVFEQKLKALGGSEKARRTQRYYMAKAIDVELDAQGRVLIRADLREFAGLRKDVIVVGMMDRAEIWDSERWNAYYDDCDESELDDVDF